MLIIGCDFHPGFQQVAIFDNLTGEIQEKRLPHREEAEQFYRTLAGQEVRVGMEACGHYPWFERLLEELGFELWLGDAAQVRAAVVRKQKTDRRDAEHLLHLLLEDRFPKIWVPSLEVRDVRQLLVHRHKQVQARTRTKNQLQAMALSCGVQKKYKLWTKAGRAECRKSTSCGPRRGERSWSSCPCCGTRLSGGSGCWKHWTGWKRRSANWTGEWRKKRDSGRRRCG